MTKKELVKSAAKLVVSYGVGSIVTNAVSFTTPAYAIGTLKRVAIGVGSFATSCMVAEAVTNWTDFKIDEAMDEFNKMMSEKKEE